MNEKQLKPFQNWVDDISVVNTLGAGWRVSLDGCDVFEDIAVHANGYTKGRKTLAIAEKIASENEAIDLAIEWVKRQLQMLEARKQ